MILKIENYRPSNLDVILDFLNQNTKLYTEDSIFGGEGKTTYTNSGKLHIDYPEIFGEFCSFVLSNFEEEYIFLDLWSNVYSKGSFVKPHSHFSEEYPVGKNGVFYIKKPKDSGNLVVEDQVIDCEENDIVIFGNSDMHWSQPNESNEDRIILSFNIIPI